jgi:hypothetical protein
MDRGDRPGPLKAMKNNADSMVKNRHAIAVRIAVRSFFHAG